MTFDTPTIGFRTEQDGSLTWFAECNRDDGVVVRLLFPITPAIRRRMGDAIQEAYRVSTDDRAAMAPGRDYRVRV